MHQTIIAAVWQDIALDLSVAILGGGVAVGAALLGNRYFHVLQLRERHHGDLNQGVLQPWRRSLQARQHGLGVAGIGSYPKISYRNPSSPFEFSQHRSGIITDDALATSPAGPLWERSREHWPALHGQWRAYLAARGRLEDKISALLEEMDQALAAAPEAAHIKWNFDDGEVGRGRRIFLTNVWQYLLQGHLPMERKIPVRTMLVEKSSEAASSAQTSDLILWDNPQCRGPPHAIAATATIILSYRDGLESRNKFVRILEESEKLFQSQVEPLLAEFERLEHDRNLAGKCDFCPRIYT